MLHLVILPMPSNHVIQAIIYNEMSSQPTCIRPTEVFEPIDFFFLHCMFSLSPPGGAAAPPAPPLPASLPVTQNSVRMIQVASKLRHTLSSV